VSPGVAILLSIASAFAQEGPPGAPDAPIGPAAPPPATEEARTPWSLAGTEDAEIRYWTSDARLPGYPDNAVFNYVEQVNRVTVNGSQSLPSGATNSIFLQVDEVALFANRYRMDGRIVEENDLTADALLSPYPCCVYANVEKVRLQRDGKTSSWALGDSYVAFGRGTALNLNRNVDIDIDTSIQGVRTMFRPGAWDVQAVIGTVNRQQVFQDNPNRALKPDMRHGVGGFRVDRYGLGPANVGLHGVAWDFVTEEGFDGFGTLGTLDAYVGGGSVEAVGVLGLDTFFEADGVFYPAQSLVGVNAASETPEASGGYTLYLSSSAYVGKTTWLFEAKRYKDAERLNGLLGQEGYKVSVPPTLEYERVITEDSSAALGSNDITGARLRVDITAIPVKLVPYVSLAAYHDADVEGLHFNDVAENIVHPVVGVEAVGDEWALLLNGGYRLDDRAGGDFGADRQTHTDIDVKFPIAGKWQGDVTAAFERYQWGKNPIQQQDYSEIESAITIQRGSDVSFIFYTDYSDNPLVNSIGNLDGFLFFDERNYAAFEVQVKPADAWTIKAFYGAYKAGIRCSGGQCRQLPGFEGARVSVVGNF
jgi:hypothetical protein